MSRPPIQEWRRAAEADVERWRRLEARADSGALDGWDLDPPDEDEDEDEDEDDAAEPTPKTQRARQNPPTGPGAWTWIAGAVLVGALDAFRKRGTR